MWSFGEITRTEDEIEARRYFVLRVKYPSVMTDRDSTYTFCTAWAQSAKSCALENPSNGRRDTAEKVLFSPSKVPFFIKKSPFLLTKREHFYTFFRARAQSDKLVFQETLSSGRQDTDEKVYYPIIVPFIFDRSLPNIYVF
jgi:hypothetical protein